MTIRISKLGLRIDGWADLVEGASGKAEVALQAVADTMKARNFPKVEIKNENVAPNLVSGKRRPYVYVEMNNGASVTTYIGQYGTDLYASWNLFVRPKLELKTIIIILVIALVIIVPCGITGLVGSLSALAAAGKAMNSYSFGQAVNVSGYYLWIIITSLCGNGVFLCLTSLLLTFLVGFAGFVVKGNWLAFFIKELTAFDADDIAAMSLGVHKSVMLALDSVGIEIKNLRLKEQFAAGGKERII